VSRRLVGAALAALLVALGLPGGARAEPVTVMTFNVWYGGVQVDFPSIGRAIRAADADIAGVQEPEGRLRRIARSAGLAYVDETLHVISATRSSPRTSAACASGTRPSTRITWSRSRTCT
jgi:hypothetical protein